MISQELKGIYPALMTAFDSQDRLNQRAMEALVKKLGQSPIDGFYVGGSSGEMLMCSQEERMALLETVLASCGQRKIIAHVGAMSTREAAALAKHAAQAKAQAISAVTPLYYKYSFAEIKCFYQRLCDASGLPMIIYNVPALTGAALSYEQLCQLLSLPGVAGMKFTSSDFFLLNRLKTAFPEKVFYNGWDEMLLSGLSAGADGGIGTTYNFMPDVFAAIRRLFLAHRMEEALLLQTLANRVIASVVRLGVLPASKQMIAFEGLDYGICREPLLPLSESVRGELYEQAWKVLDQGRKDWASLLAEA